MQDVGDVGRHQDGHVGGGEGELALVRDGGGFAAVVVAGHDQHATVRFHAAPDVVARLVGPTVGVIRRGAANRRHTVVDIGGDLDWIARYLAGCEVRFEVLEPPELRDELRHALTDEGVRQISSWTARYKSAVVSWPIEPVDPFFNANTTEDIAEAERLATLVKDQ